MRLPGPDSSCFRASPLVGIVEPIRAAALALCALPQASAGVARENAWPRRGGRGGDWGAGDWVLAIGVLAIGVLAIGVLAIGWSCLVPQAEE